VLENVVLICDFFFVPCFVFLLAGAGLVLVVVGLLGALSSEAEEAGGEAGLEVEAAGRGEGWPRSPLGAEAGGEGRRTRSLLLLLDRESLEDDRGVWAGEGDLGV